MKHSAIDESKIDWASLKEKWGIDRDALEKSGDLKEMLYNRKSKLVTVTPTFAGEKFPIDARLSFRTDPDGNVKVVPHFIHKEPKLDQGVSRLPVLERGQGRSPRDRQSRQGR